jgi:6-pyruvoyltetrahydropterin/6-carboxytetrahydropterin synthase
VADDTDYQSTKTFTNYPCAHRQHRHTGNCALVHGYSRSFVFLFRAQTLDRCGFVVDFGDLDWLKAHLERMYDHTLLLEADDPLLHAFTELHEAGACMLRVAKYGVGMEGTAQELCEFVDAELRRRTKGRAWCVAVEARENDKNSAVYRNPNAGFQGWL